MKGLLTLYCLATISFGSAQQQLNVIPLPASVISGKGKFAINKNTRVLCGSDAHSQNMARQLVDRILNVYGIALAERKNISAGFGNNYIVLNAVQSTKENTEAYALAVSANGITISSSTPAGLYYGYQTLLQLLPEAPGNNGSLLISQLSIKDAPRFKYRGVHLDVARHFMPVSFIKKYLDYLASFKFNTFHWHLTDDQGWRIEIKKYPLLTSVGGYRNGTITGPFPGTGNDSLHYGGFYTQEEIREVVKYASERYIDVIPEIEMPGHASAAIAGYPQLSCFPEENTEHPKACAWAGTTNGKQVQQTWGVFEDVFCPSDYTFNFLQDVIDEVLPLFPSGYIHIGGDECPKEAWKRSPFCQQLIKDKKLKDEHGLQSYFIQRIEKYINSKGKKIIGWDEILEGGLAPNATVMSWRGEEGGITAAKQQHDVIMTPGSHCYLDHAQSKTEDSITIGGYLPIEVVYEYDPVPAQLTPTQAKYILGAQANVWSEYMRTPGKVEYMLFPRLAAMAEVLWTPKHRKNWSAFEKRLPVIFERMDRQKINYSKAYYAIESVIKSTPEFKGLLVSVSSKAKAPVYINLNRADSIFVYHKPILITSSGSLSAYINDPSVHIGHQFKFNKATGKKITLTNPPSDKYAAEGALTLVNGIQNSRGFARSDQFIGFEGKVCEAIVDFGKTESIKKITVHAMEQKSNWIWCPQTVEAWGSMDDVNFKPIGITSNFVADTNSTGTMTIVCDAVNARFIKLVIQPLQSIPEGQSGAGYPAWIFIDEVEVE